MPSLKGKQIFDTLEYREAADGDTTVLDLRNIQANAGGSTNETTIIKFGFGALPSTESARLTVGKTADFTSGPNENAFMAWSISHAGSILEGLRITSDGTNVRVGIGDFSASTVDEILHTSRNVDGGDVAILIENSFPNASASVDETASLKFGFGGVNNAVILRAEKLSNFVGGGNQDSALDIRLRGDGAEFSALYVSANDLVTVRPQIGIGTDGNTNLDIHTTLHMIERSGTSSTRGYRTIMQADASRECQLVLRNDNDHIMFGMVGRNFHFTSGASPTPLNNFVPTSPVTLFLTTGSIGLASQGGNTNFNITCLKGMLVRSALTTPGLAIHLLKYDNTAETETFEIEMNVNQRVEFKLSDNIPDMEFQWENLPLVKFHRFGDTQAGVFINGGNATPVVILQVNVSSSQPAPPTLDQTTGVIINSTQFAASETGLTILSGLTGTSRIMFGNKDTQVLGSIEYDNADDFMAFRVNTNEVIRITSGGFMGLGATAAEELLHLERIVDGGGVSLLVENSFVNVSASTDETANILFGFGGINDAAQIKVGKLNDFVDAADRDSFMTLSILDGGAQAVAIRFEGSGGTKIGLYAVTPVVQASKISDPSGGGTVDAESRTAINAIVDALEGIGVSAAA